MQSILEKIIEGIEPSDMSEVATFVVVVICVAGVVTIGIIAATFSRYHDRRRACDLTKDLLDRGLSPTEVCDLLKASGTHDQDASKQPNAKAAPRSSGDEAATTV